MDKTALIAKIVNRMMSRQDNEAHMDVDVWDWVAGVGMYGVARAWRYTENNADLLFLKDWIDRHWHDAAQIKTVNHTAPYLTILFLDEVTRAEKYRAICRQRADWLIRDAAITGDGGLEHTVSDTGRHEFPEQMWGDTLFMAGIFLARMGRRTGNRDYLKAACRQLALHHKFLKDPNSGLFYHGWNCRTRDWMSGALWARANAWMTVSSVEMLEELPETFDGRAQIIASLQDQVSALQKVQRGDGMFGTVLDVPDAYDETSATAGFAYGIKRGVKKGFLTVECADIWRKAEKAVIGKVDEQGTVLGVSGGTPVMPSSGDYNTIAVLPTLYGQALALLMLCED